MLFVGCVSTGYDEHEPRTERREEELPPVERVESVPMEPVDAELEPATERESPDPEPAPVVIPDRLRPYPAPAGPQPEDGDTPALLGFLRTLPSEKSLQFPPGTDQVIERYLGSFSLDGVHLSLVPVSEHRGGAYYGRVDIVVSPLAIFRDHVRPLTVRGPTVFSGASALDAELGSLHQFPKGALERSADRVRHETELLVLRRGVPLRVEMQRNPPAEDREWVVAVLRSIGRPGERPDEWWFFRPPPETERYLRDYLGNEGFDVTVDTVAGSVLLRGTSTGEEKEEER
ncbi:MAG: hypothetical protein EA427_04150 [Spirochaetaceae bacterium]|nr:MAG: hypothetical protein EA427_04150 [Spirochaetaceae bacterium]